MTTYVQLAALPDDENNIFSLIAVSHKDNLALITHPYLLLSLTIPYSDLIEVKDGITQVHKKHDAYRKKISDIKDDIAKNISCITPSSSERYAALLQKLKEKEYSDLRLEREYKLRDEIRNATTEEAKQNANNIYVTELLINGKILSQCEHMISEEIVFVRKAEKERQIKIDDDSKKAIEEYSNSIIKKYEKYWKKGDNVLTINNGTYHHSITTTSNDINLDTQFIFTITHSNDHTYITLYHNNNEYGFYAMNNEINNHTLFFSLLINGDLKYAAWIIYNVNDDELKISKMDSFVLQTISFERTRDESKMFKASLNELMKMTIIPK